MSRNWAKIVGFDGSDGVKTKARKLRYDPERNIYTRDPDGNLLEFMTYPH